ncbi:MAG: DEAD/DEAH box helicase family protein [Kiritimatiellae bacterium]|nr:DEAD/DEAH box helicase family protein [Kiritimatiellia bacterium]
MQLKKYQNDTLGVIKEYFAALGTKTPEEAYKAITESSLDMMTRLGNLRHYDELLLQRGVSEDWRSEGSSKDGLQASNTRSGESNGDFPVVSIRVPTGGGKTIIAAHAVKIIAEAQGREYPLVIWFAPSEAIRRQTAEALKKPKHPYRQALDEAFWGNVRIFDLDEVATMSPADLEGNACIVVATEQAFVKKDKAKYNVYKHSENFEQHFATIRYEEGMDALETKTPKFSFVNLVHSRHPIVIVDEAHKMASELSKETLRRLAPSAVLGLSATPDRGNNTLYSVHAKELFDEQMIKLPIELVEFRDQWEQAVFAAIAKRQELEKLADAELAQGSGGYLRPLVLFQAQAKTKTADVPVEVLKRFLVETAKIPEKEIAVVTGEQKELDGIDVNDPKCPVRYIITVQALKEGWDCPAAYVLCSVANISSNKDTIQLLGRVMRQPNAARRKTPQLNRSYAFVMSKAFGSAAAEFAEGLRKRGFEETEAMSAIVPVQPVFFIDGEDGENLFNQPDSVTVSSEVYEAIANSLPDDIEVTANPNGSGTIAVEADISDESASKVANLLHEKGQTALAAQFLKKVARKKSEKADAGPAEPVKMEFPKLCAAVQGEFCFDAEEAQELAGEDLCKELEEKHATLADGEFEIKEQGDRFVLELNGNEIKQQFASGQMTFLQELKTELAPGDVVNALAAMTRHNALAPRAMRGWIAGIVNHLVAAKGFAPEQLYCFRYKLRDRLYSHIAEAVRTAREKAYQEVFFDDAHPAEVDVERAFVLDKTLYRNQALLKVYRGSYRFNKHFLGTHRIPEFDGQLKYGEGEEFECAKLIDAHGKVKTWLRNLDKCEESFWLPLAHARFFPDFAGVLDDGRLFAIEYKGAHLRNAKDTLEKDAIGRLWAERSGGRCLYATVFMDNNGLNVQSQLDRLFAS